MYTEPVVIPKHIKTALAEASTLANNAHKLKLNAMRGLFATLPHKVGDPAVIVKNGKRKIKAKVAAMYFRPTDKMEYVFRARNGTLFREVHVFAEDTVIWEG